MEADPRQYENIAVNESDIHEIVLSYLVHNCFNNTIESFIASTGMKQLDDHVENLQKRKQVYHFALDGHASKAIELTEEFVPGLLEENKDLHFDLLSLHFVELVCSRKCAEALGFAQTKLTPFGKEHKYVEKLEDFMALLAYEEPEKSPMFHLLSLEYRQHVADNLNRAILAHTKLPCYSTMERLIQQTTVVRQCLCQEFGKEQVVSLARDSLHNTEFGLFVGFIAVKSVTIDAPSCCQAASIQDVPAHLLVVVLSSLIQTYIHAAFTSSVA